jgi:hypothetical protein
MTSLAPTLRKQASRGEQTRFRVWAYPACTNKRPAPHGSEHASAQVPADSPLTVGSKQNPAALSPDFGSLAA